MADILKELKTALVHAQEQQIIEANPHSPIPSKEMIVFFFIGKQPIAHLCK
jgi:hypothetical protein